MLIRIDPREMGQRHERTIADLFRDYCDDPDLPAGWSIWDPGDFTMYWAEREVAIGPSTEAIAEAARAIDCTSIPVGSVDVAVARVPDIFFCTPDRIIVDRDDRPIAVLELKCAWNEQARRYKQEFPAEHQIQAQAQMHATGLPVAYYGVLLWGLDFRWFKQERNQRFIDACLPKLRDFWQFVQSKTPPPADFNPATTKALATHYREPEPAEIRLADEFDGAGSELDRIEAKLGELTRAKAGIENKVRAAMGNSTEGVTPDGTLFTWRADKRGRRTLRRQGKAE